MSKRGPGGRGLDECSAVSSRFDGSGAAEEVLTVDVATFEGGRFVVAGTAPPGAEVRVVGTDVANEADPKTGAFRIARRTVLPACTVTVEFRNPLGRGPGRELQGRPSWRGDTAADDAAAPARRLELHADLQGQ